MNPQKPSENSTSYMPIYMCLGLSIGTALGVATDKLSIYMPIGLSLGMCIGAFIDDRNRKKSADSSDEKED